MSEITTEKLSNEIKDKLGRTIVLKPITGRMRIAFYRALGARDAVNLAIVNEYFYCMAVHTIDGNFYSLNSIVELDAIYNELERGEAFGLIDEWLAKQDAEKKSSEKEDNEFVKKS